MYENLPFPCLKTHVTDNHSQPGTCNRDCPHFTQCRELILDAFVQCMHEDFIEELQKRRKHACAS